MKYIVSFLSLFVLASCQAKSGSDAHDVMQVKLFSGLQCPSAGGAALARRVPDAAALRQLINGVPQSVISKRTDLPSFDFKQRSLLLVTMGQRPNAGYGLELLDEKLGREGKDLVLRLRWKRPEADRFYAAVITYPCLWLDMPKLPGVGVRIVDEKGTQQFYLP